MGEMTTAFIVFGISIGIIEARLNTECKVLGKALKEGWVYRTISHLAKTGLKLSTCGRQWQRHFARVIFTLI
jgi:hypothetical protein